MRANGQALVAAEQGRAEEALRLTEVAAEAANGSDDYANRMAVLVSDDLHGLIEDDQGRVVVPTSDP